MTSAYVPLHYIMSWPEASFPLPADSSFMHLVGVSDFSNVQQSDGTDLIMEMKVLEEVSLEVTGLEGWQVVFGSNEGVSTFTTRLSVGEEITLNLEQVSVSLRLPSSWLKSMRWHEDKFVEDRDEHDELRPFEIRLAEVDIEVKLNKDWEPSIHIRSNDNGMSVNPVMIGNTGVIVEADNISLHLSGEGAKPNNAEQSWKGLLIETARIHIPSLMSGYIEATNLGIGSGGCYGKIEGVWELDYNPQAEPPFSGDLAGEVIGMTGGISSISLEFIANVPVKAEIEAKLNLPFFDEPVAILAGLGLDGQLSVALMNTDGEGLYRLRKDNVLEVRIASMAFARRKDHIWEVAISGEIQPLVGDVEWPSFHVDRLTVDSIGQIQMNGGWMDLPSIKSFDFYGFETEISRVGLGTGGEGDGDPYRWVGLSGGMNLVEGLDAGGSVDGLRLKWWPDGRTAIDLQGIGIHFEIPNVLEFAGDVRLLQNHATGFSGEVELNLIAVGVRLEAAIIIGKTTEEPKHSFCYLFIKSNWPTGIPLGTSGISLYGLSGLFAHHMEPNKSPQEEWYEGWYLKDTPGVSATSKWKPEYGSMAFGAGVSLGTTIDDGFTLSAETLLAIIIPGPILMIEGVANLLQKPADHSSEEGQAEGGLRAFAVLDNRAGQFLMNIDASYQYDEKGRVLDIYAGAEAFFDYHRPGNWHVYLGEKEPLDKRIRASIISLYTAQTYLMLESGSLAFGYWQGFDEQWKLGPVRIAASAYAEAEIKASTNPQQFWGHVGLHGSLEIDVFSFGMAMYLDASITVNVPTPYSIKADLSFGISLPWPFPDIDVDLQLKWREKHPLPQPLPLKEVAVAHEFVQGQTLLRRGEWLLPNYDNNQDGFIDNLSTNHSEPDEDELPVVPLDARPVLMFNKFMKDTANIAYNPSEVDPGWQKIAFEGEDDEFLSRSFRFSLTNITLERKSGSHWTANDNDGQPLPVHGVWLAVEDEQGKPTQTMLQLWSTSPFEQIRYGTRDIRDAWEERHPSYPCLPPVSKEKVCEDFAHPQSQTKVSWKSDKLQLVTFGTDTVLKPEHEQLVIRNRNFSRDSLYMSVVLAEECGFLSMQVIHEKTNMHVSVLDNNGDVINQQEISAHISVNETNGYTTYTFGQVVEDGLTPRMQGLRIEVYSSGGDRGDKYFPEFGCMLKQLCYIPCREYEREQAYYAFRNKQQSLVERSIVQDHILQPHTFYRMVVNTKIEEKEERDIKEQALTEYIYFRTQGPPGYTDLALAVREEDRPANQPHPLHNLDRYVAKTIPAEHLLYRAYDLHFEFATSYVRLMYQLDLKDLVVLLIDQNENKLERRGIWRKQRSSHQDEALQPLWDAKSSCVEWPEPNKVDVLLSPSSQWLPAMAKMKAQIVPVGRVGRTDTENYYLSPEHPVLYELSLQTSRYAHFVDHFHSFNQRIWEAPYMNEDATMVRDTTMNSLVTDDDEFVKRYPWPIIAPERLSIDITRDQEKRPDGFLLRSPEPVEWNRISVTLTLVKQEYEPTIPGIAKLIDWKESVSEGVIRILLREQTSMQGWRIETTSDGSRTAGATDWVTLHRFEEAIYHTSGRMIPVPVSRTLANDLHGDLKGRRFRLLDQNGELIHEQVLICGEPEVIALQNLSVYPSADGAAAMLIPHRMENIDFSNHILRWHFQYARKQEGLPTYSQDGNEQEEHVVLEAIYVVQ